jgi:hypothetical protein
MIVRSWLRCARCARETPHDLLYLGTTLQEASCVACGLQTPLEDAPLGHFLGDVAIRLRSKPERMARELRRSPRCVLTLPRRIASKPSRVGHEMRDVIRVLPSPSRRPGR